jgi:hypothetical protein
MTQHGGRSYGEDGSHQPAPTAEEPVADRINARVHDVEPTAAQPVVDGAPRRTRRDQLSPSNDAMLALRQPRDPMVDRPNIAITVVWRGKRKVRRHG